ncbi:MAG TPA: formate dehydrogenase accessory sulfurtransferase FdhD, partial [Verrucomicrobiae bacterium]|nr:formate dehydrogenase accessory sulfurtransferase FdhD [Verrucomicrobiae bacterium]
MPTNTSLRRVKEMAMRRVNGSIESDDKDFLAAEEPLEIRVEGHSVAVVMRTPGEDRELAVGFLVTEGVVHQASDIVDVKHVTHCLVPERAAGSPEPLPAPKTELNLSDGNIIDVRLSDPDSVDLKKLTRHVFTSSSCGICSKASIDAVRQQFPPLVDFCEVEPQVLMELPALLAAAQETFKRTGGLHACALFDVTG